MTTATMSCRDEIGALIMGLGLLCIGTVALIGGSGLVLWIAGLH